MSEATSFTDRSESKSLLGPQALTLDSKLNGSDYSFSHIQETNRLKSDDQRYKASGVLPADFQIAGLESTSQKYTVYDQPAAQALQPPGPISETLTTGPYDSPIKLNVQITNVPEVSSAVSDQELTNYFSVATQSAATITSDSALQVAENLAKPNAINDDLISLAHHFSQDSNQFNKDAQAIATGTMREVENIADKLDKPMTPDQRAEMAGAVLPVFLMDGEALNPKVSNQMGLEQMTPAQLEALGIKRTEIRLNFERDETSFQARVKDDPRAICRIETPSPGVVECTDLYRGSLPEGTGNFLLSETLQNAGVMPTKQLVLRGIINPPTLAAFEQGLSAEDTLVAKSATKALKSLGIEPTSYRYQVVGDKLNIVIETGR